MADESSPDPTPDPDDAATPNRDRRHEPPVIEGEIADRHEPEPSAAVEPAAVEPAAVEPAAVEPAPRVEAAAAAAPFEQPPSARSRPLLSAAIGALAGALVAAGGLWLLAPRPATDPDVLARLEKLEQAPSATADLAALDKRVGTLEARSAGAPDKGVIDAYGQRLAALESAAPIGKASADAARNALAAAAAARDDAAKALALASATAQRLSETPAAAPAKQAGAPSAAALEGRVAKLESDLAPLARLTAALDPLSQRLDKLEQALAAPKTESRVAADSAPQARDGASLAVVAQAVLGRLRAGAPFPIELTALEHLGADPAKLAVLKPLAENGAPSAGALAAAFAKVAPAAQAAAAPESSGGAWDRLLANMGKLVRVTPVGEAAGDDPAALISQVGAALARGNVAAAAAIWARLPEPARQASKLWGDEAQAALAADKAAQGVLDDAVARLAAAKN